MSDQPGAGSPPELTPEQESEVRRLLADARHDEPVPADVGERLDRVLAELSRDDPGAPGVAPVIDLAARRRRRNAAAVLAGAAAVIVAGFAIGQVIDVGAGDTDGGEASSSAVNADRGAAESPKSAGAGDQSLAPSGDSLPLPTSSPPVLMLSSRHLARDLNRQLGRLQDGSDLVTGQSAEAYGTIGCPAPAHSSKFGLGDLFPALFDDQPAVVALRPPVDGRQRADVLTCDTAAELGSASIPVR